MRLDQKFLKFWDKLIYFELIAEKVKEAKTNNFCNWKVISREIANCIGDPVIGGGHIAKIRKVKGEDGKTYIQYLVKNRHLIKWHIGTLNKRNPFKLDRETPEHIRSMPTKRLLVYYKKHRFHHYISEEEILSVKIELSKREHVPNKLEKRKHVKA
jgi:hypothetical protein